MFLRHTCELFGQGREGFNTVILPSKTKIETLGHETTVGEKTTLKHRDSMKRNNCL